MTGYTITVAIILMSIDRIEAFGGGCVPRRKRARVHDSVVGDSTAY